MVPIDSHVLQDLLTENPRFLDAGSAQYIHKWGAETSQYDNNAAGVGI